jgi:hypothetical protein
VGGKAVETDEPCACRKWLYDTLVPTRSMSKERPFSFSFFFSFLYMYCSILET